MIYPISYVFVTGIDLGIRYPITLFNSYHRFYNITQPYELITYLDDLNYKILKTKNKKEKKRLKNEYENRRIAMVVILSDYIMKILPPYSILAFEDINYKDGWPSLLLFDLLVNRLDILCKQKGIQLVKVDPINTSNMCPRCGHIDKNNRDKVRHIYVCNHCGLVCNDDAIAAWNIHNRAYEQVFGRKFDTTIGGEIPVIVRENKNIPFNNIIPE